MRRALLGLGCGALLMSACSSPIDTAPPLGDLDAPLVSGSMADGVSTAVLALGHLNDPKNTFFELLASASIGAGFRLATPSGTTTNGGIVVSAPSGVAAIRQFDLLRSSALVQLTSGAEQGSAEIAPEIGPGPSSVARDPSSGAVALLSAKGSVVVGRGLAGPFHTVATLFSLRQLTEKHCAPSAITSVAYSSRGQLALGLRCTRGNGLGILTSAGGSPWVLASAAAPGSSAPSSVLRLDPAGDGGFDALVLQSNSIRMVHLIGGIATLSAPVSVIDVATLRSTTHSEVVDAPYALVAVRNDGSVITCRVDRSPVGTSSCRPAQSSATVLVFPQAGGGLLTLWVTNGGTVHVQNSAGMQVLKVSVPYGSAK